MTDFPTSDDPAVTPPDLTEPAEHASTAQSAEPAESGAGHTEPESGVDPVGDAFDPHQGTNERPSDSPPPPPLPPPRGGPSGYGAPRGSGPGPVPVRRIYRSRHDRKVAGVSAGIAEYFGIDPTIVRLATLAFMISGVGIPVYIAAWILVPQRPDGLPYHRPAHPAANERTMTLAFGLAALALAFGIVTGSWEVLAIALIGAGIWLLSEHTTKDPTSTPVPYIPAPMQPATGAYQPQDAPVYAASTLGDTGYGDTSYGDTGYGDTGYGDTTYGAASYPPPVNNPTPAPERKPQRITWIVLSMLALLAAVGMAAASGDWWNVSATRFLGIGVIIIGVGVVVGQLRHGGARGLIPLGLLCALALFPVSAVDGLIDDGIGETTYRPSSFIEVQDTYSHGIGKLTVDLTELDFTDRNETIDIELGIGELIVVVPEEAGGQVVLQAKAGEISHRLPNTDSFLFEEGVNIETGTVRLEGDQGSLDLNINVGLGTAELRSEKSQ